MIDEFLANLYAAGVEIDRLADSHSRMMLNITPGTGRFLELLITDSKPGRILELGTSNGYSTIWIARAAREIGATVDTVDISRFKSERAAENLAATGLDTVVTLSTADAGDFLSASATAKYDFVFLDSARDRYAAWLDDLLRVTTLGTIVADNAISHADAFSELKEKLDARKDLAYCTLPIGKGQMVIRSRSQVGGDS